MAVFDCAIGKLGMISVAPLIEHADFLEALDGYEIILLNVPE